VVSAVEHEQDARQLAPGRADASRSPRTAAAWAVLDGVPDPEVPALSVLDLGLVRDVVDHGDALEVVLTPTYSGCPATEAIERDVVAALDAAGLGPARTTLRRAPAWSSDWLSDAGRRKLAASGIAPPGPAAAAAAPIRFVGRRAGPVACPRCGSARTERLSAFGSTACKALWRCLDCREPFEHFKPI
jgi:ring-1,2-phenylacetyl-CoA epoxidase subunit PaaD